MWIFCRNGIRKRHGLFLVTLSAVVCLLPPLLTSVPRLAVGGEQGVEEGLPTSVWEPVSEPAGLPHHRGAERSAVDSAHSQTHNVLANTAWRVCSHQCTLKVMRTYYSKKAVYVKWVRLCGLTGSLNSSRCSGRCPGSPAGLWRQGVGVQYVWGAAQRHDCTRPETFAGQQQRSQKVRGKRTGVHVCVLYYIRTYGVCVYTNLYMCIY